MEKGIEEGEQELQANSAKLEDTEETLNAARAELNQTELLLEEKGKEILHLKEIITQLKEEGSDEEARSYEEDLSALE